jgi:carbonic anhydrase|tara:strand:+ start:351 stop:980 length:630 start_codon:yes stop_codon:yes gene_type:complete
MEEYNPPTKALKLLKEGNERFVNNLSVNRNLMEDARSTSEGQEPIAVVLSCLDSRSSADIIFDQPIGGVFSARVAGNIVNDDILGSMEFACELSTAKLILVLGHSDCGAVKGAIGDPSDDVAEIEMNNLINLLEKIKPAMNAVTKPKPQNERNNKNRKFVDNVTKENVILTIENIRKGSRTLLNLEKSGEIMIVGGIHNLSDGTIKYIK